jgi:glycerol-3-phosphate dehydrogenase
VFILVFFLSFDLGKDEEMMEQQEDIFSRYSRQKNINQMKHKELDVLIIGGGITGCGIALDATLRGLDVGLVEMQDFAAGTSSRSTKLIHGGLRYLKQFEINLVREVGQERAILHQNAPHVVVPESMLLPLTKGGTFGKLATSFGLALYDWLAGVKKKESRKMLSRAETLKREPLLKEEGLKGGGLYVEYRTDDARLTLEVIKTAVTYGAKALNYTKVTDFIYSDQGKVIGVNVHNLLEDETYQIKAKKIVNASGPWVDDLRKKAKSLNEKRLHLTKGVHIVIDQSRFPLKQATYFDCSDGRMIFAIPRDRKTYIGTTDTDFKDNPIDPKMSELDLAYLLHETNNMFPTLALTNEDVESHWVGLRPLIHEEGKSPSELSRKDEIFHSETGLITIAGGKLTGYRKMAEKVVNLVVKELSENHEKSYPPCQTDQQVLSGGDVGGAEMWVKYFDDKVVHAMEIGLDEDMAKTIVRRYGSNVEKVLNNIDNVQQKAKHYHVEPIFLAELVYGIEEEMVVTADDFLIRRTSDAYFNVKRYNKYYELTEQVIREINHHQLNHHQAY